jgi:hypothetical protein
LLDELDMSAGSDGGAGAAAGVGGAAADTARTFLTAMAAAATSDGDELPAGPLDLSLLGRQVVVELKTANALPLLKYACSSRVKALPTSQLNAQRVRRWCCAWLCRKRACMHPAGVVAACARACPLRHDRRTHTCP